MKAELVWIRPFVLDPEEEILSTREDALPIALSKYFNVTYLYRSDLRTFLSRKYRRRRLSSIRSRRFYDIPFLRLKAAKHVGTFLTRFQVNLVCADKLVVAWYPTSIIPDRHSFLIYDCCDEWLDTRAAEIPQFFENERILVKRADLVLAVSSVLMKKCLQYNENVVLVPNAVDLTKFNPHIPKESMHTIIGFVGSITESFDLDLVDFVARRFPSYKFWIIGPLRNVNIDPKKFPDNVKFFGSVPHSRLQFLIKEFDVAMLPFKGNAHTNASNPKVIYELAAMGKPCVVTNLKSMRDFGSIMYVAEDADAFCAKIEEALRNAKVAREQLINFARKNTWDSRALVVVQQVSKLLQDKECQD